MKQEARRVSQQERAPHTADLAAIPAQVPRLVQSVIFFHPLAWLSWLGAALVAFSTTRNPLYLTIILLCVAVVHAAVRPSVDARLLPVSPFCFALFVIVSGALLNAATAHIGTTVLLRVPSAVPLLGGNITLEALAYGAINGMIIGGLYAAFSVLNLVLPTRALIQLIPRAFHPLALVISIAVTFVPTTLRQLHHIREAQAVRGHRMHGLRDWIPLLMPLLVGGLERALQLAEAMTARGFAGAGSRSQAAATRLVVIGGLTALLAGWLLRLAWGLRLGGAALMCAGAAMVLGALWVAGRSVPRTVYRPQRWTMPDSLLLLCAVLVGGALLLPVPGLNQETLFYQTYPSLQLPPFDALIGATIMGLLGPLLQALKRPRKSQ